MPSSEIIDQATFTRFFDSLGGDVDFLNELVEAYLDSSPDLFGSMRQAILAGEAPALQRAAHSLKSGSASFGAMTFAAACKELEELGKMGMLTQAEEKLKTLEVAYSEVVAALQAQVQQASSPRLI
jgi:HPt (histidine-containing phosphotransfer) domain-containing protein